MDIKDFTTGVQHIGIPTDDIEKTIEFYQALGFETTLRTINGTEEVAFLQLHNLTIETYQNRQAKMEYGAIDHISIDVKDIENLFNVVKEAGTFKMLDRQVNSLPFWKNRVLRETIARFPEVFHLSIAKSRDRLSNHTFQPFTDRYIIQLEAQISH